MIRITTLVLMCVCGYSCAPRYYDFQKPEEVVLAQDSSFDFNRYVKYTFELKPYQYFKNQKIATALLSPNSKFIKENQLFNIPIDSNYYVGSNLVNSKTHKINVFIEKGLNQNDSLFEGSKVYITSISGKIVRDGVFKKIKKLTKVMVYMSGEVIKNNTSSAREGLDFVEIDHVVKKYARRKGKIKTKIKFENRKAYAFILNKKADKILVKSMIDYGKKSKARKMEIYDFTSLFGEGLWFEKIKL